MGIDVPSPIGIGDRTLLGHRLLLVLRSGPKSMRGLHAATGRAEAAVDLRAALAELRASGLLAMTIELSGPSGGRPREVWRLLPNCSAAVARAEVAVATASAGRTRRQNCSTPGRPLAPAPGGVMPRDRAHRPRPWRPTPADVAEEICKWIASGRSLLAFCRRPGRPRPRTIYYWAARDLDFFQALQQAREFGRMLVCEERCRMADAVP